MTLNGSLPGARRIFGVSLKMYMSLRQTQDWIAGVAELARGDWPPGLDFFVIPDFISLSAARVAFAQTRVQIGAQNLYWEDFGPFTGEISAPMLVEAGCRYVEIGHAERRRLFGESDEIIARKVEAAVRWKLVPILCVGESEPVGPEAAARFCVRQLQLATSRIQADAPLIIAYEPVWAIGAAEPASPEHIVSVAAGLHFWRSQRADTRLIYGGSVKPGLFSRINSAVDGLFLGRFVHDLRSLAEVIREAAQS
ncbi:MAG: triose-phosphate isomerase [Terracidiphilus sp.]